MANIITKITPQQVTEQTNQQNAQAQVQQQITNLSQDNPKIIEQNISPDQKPQGAGKLAIFLNKKRNEIKSLFIPIIVGIATKIGIQNIGTPLVKIPDTCLSQDEINKLISTRNKLVNRLNNVVKTIDALSKVLTGLGLAVNILNKLNTTLSIARSTLKTTAQSVPVPPSAPDPGNSLIVSSDNIKSLQDNVIKEKIGTISGVISSIGLSLSLINNTLYKLIVMLNSIDQYFRKCSTNPDLVSLSDSLLEIERINKDIEQTNNEVTYQGFILEIIEEPYSSTVNRRKAVAKNNQGIILLQTPLSFTTLNEVLIQELKLIIDSSNLRAD